MSYRDEKLQDIKCFIQKDLLAADLKLSLFISAAKSYKKDFLLNPFPAFYINNEIKDFDKLINDLEQIPPLEELLVMMLAEFGNEQLLSDSVIKLLHWILIEYLKYDVQTVPKSKYDEILSLSKSTGKYQLPNYIFQISYKNTSASEKKFNQLKSVSKCTKFAYHGTKFYCMYSILNYGLQQHLNKTALFGEGLYFSFELQVSQLFSQSVLSWNKSKLGELISCTAVCEYIDDPNFARIRKENAKNSDIPQNYLLITNNEIVRPRYLLVYGSKKPTLKKSPSINNNSTTQLIDEPRSLISFCRRNPLIISAILYVLMLLFVGLSSHRSVEHYKNLLMNFLKKRFKFE